MTILRLAQPLHLIVTMGKCILLLSLLFSTTVFGADEPDWERTLDFLLPASVAREFREVSDELVARFPPKKNLIISPGRSLFPVIADLENRFDGYAVQFPLSIKGLFFVADAQEPLHEHTLEVLKSHFTEWLPPKSAVQGKKIVVIDYVSRGVSLSVATRLVRDFYDKDIPVEGVGVGHLNGRTVDQSRERWGHPVIGISEDLHIKLANNKFKPFAPYSFWMPGFPAPEKTLRSQYVLFKKRMAFLLQHSCAEAARSPGRAREARSAWQKI